MTLLANVNESISTDHGNALDRLFPVDAGGAAAIPFSDWRVKIAE
jgi:hypothetical protein